MSDKIVILTGAGVSAESGLGTFRDKDGLWTKYPLEDVATPEGFARNPEMVQDFYNQRRANAASKLSQIPPIIALAKLEQDHSGDVLLVTQNVDGLHEAAGSQNVIHMHGELSKALCNECGATWPAPAVMNVSDPCPHCAAHLRPAPMSSGSAKCPIKWTPS